MCRNFKKLKFLDTWHVLNKYNNVVSCTNVNICIVCVITVNRYGDKMQTHVKITGTKSEIVAIIA